MSDRDRARLTEYLLHNHRGDTDARRRALDALSDLELAQLAKGHLDAPTWTPPPANDVAPPSVTNCPGGPPAGQVFNSYGRAYDPADALPLPSDPDHPANRQ